MENKFIIIPSCSDFNRGDQALVWETKRLAEDAGYFGKYYFMAEAKEPVDQSCKQGLELIHPILEHPSRKFKSKNNINLSWTLKLKWGSLALVDFLWSVFLLTPLRTMILPLLSKEKREYYNVFRDSEAVFVKGGGFIHSYGGAMAPYYIYFQLFHIYLAESLGKKVYIFPNSFGPFKGIGVKWMIKRAFKKAEIVLSRERRSGLECRKSFDVDVETYPDFGFYLSNTSFDTKEVFFEKMKIPLDRKIVALTVRPHRFVDSSNPMEAYRMFQQSIKKFSLWLYEKHYFPVFIEHVYAINDHENDSYCINSIIKDLPAHSYAYYQNRNLSCQELKTIYGFFDYIVGTRFHSMIFSMANYVPGIAITYVGNKGEGIMEDMGLNNFFLKIKEVNFETLISKFEYLIANEDFAKTKIEEYISYAQLKRTEIIKKIQIHAQD